eukprot:1293594-Amphidinium_carterae.1
MRALREWLENELIPLQGHALPIQHLNERLGYTRSRLSSLEINADFIHGNSDRFRLVGMHSVALIDSWNNVYEEASRFPPAWQGMQNAVPSQACPSQSMQRPKPKPLVPNRPQASEQWHAQGMTHLDTRSKAPPPGYAHRQAAPPRATHPI